MILALDASISSTGYAVINSDKALVEFNKITTKSKEAEDDRIFKISNKVKELIETYNINTVVMEAQFLGRNVRTAMQLSRLRGAIIFVCKLLQVDLIHLMPSEIRKFLFNNGSASKEEVANFIKGFYINDENVQALGEFNDRQCKAKNSDIYDAISIALAFTNKHNEEGIEVKWKRIKPMA